MKNQTQHKARKVVKDTEDIPDTFSPFERSPDLEFTPLVIFSFEGLEGLLRDNMESDYAFIE